MLPRFPVPSDRPSNGLPTPFLRFRNCFHRARSEACLRLAPCTLAVPARSCDAAFGPWGSRAPSKPHREYHPTKMISETSLKSVLSVPGLRFGFRSFALPVPCSLFPVPFFQDQALDRLVSSSSIRYRTSTDDLSTLSSSRGLTCSKQWQFSSLGGLHA